MVVLTVMSASTFGITVPPVLAQRGGAVRGPHGGGAARGPAGGGAVRGPYGGGAARGSEGAGAVRGPADAGAVRGPEGGGAVRGPYGGGAVRGPEGGAVVDPGYRRVGYDPTPYRDVFVGYPGYVAYDDYYGPYGPLANYPGLAFLSAGLLIASFTADSGETVYVYHVSENCVIIEYQVDETGNTISTKEIGPDEEC